ncbi:hypothetical protein [Rhizobium paranaense]
MDTVRKGAEEVAPALAEKDDTLVIVDATFDQDLIAIGQRLTTTSW